MMDVGPVLRTPRCVVRLAGESDIVALLRYWQQNGDRYAPPLPSALLSEASWRERTAASRQEFLEGTSWKPYVFSTGTTAVVGTISLVIVRGREGGREGRLGYAIAGSHEGQGLMYEAVNAALAYAFESMGVVRIEATCDAANARSLRLLHRLGFAPASEDATTSPTRHLVRARHCAVG